MRPVVGTTAQWAASTRIMVRGQRGHDSDTGTMRIGDGVNLWAALDIVASGTPDAVFLQRANHVGTQAASTISDFNTAADARVVAGITGKQDTLVSGTSIKTINGTSVLGSGDIVVSGGATNLAYDAATRVVSSDTGTDATLPLMSSGNAGLVPASGGGTATFLRADGTFAAPAGGGATGGTATLNFGTGTGSAVATVAVTGQAGILSGSRVRVWFMAATTADHNADEHGLIFPARVGLSAGNITAGVGFTIYAETELQLTGNVSVCWEWS